MTNYEAIQQFEVSGVRPFENLPVNALAGMFSCLHCKNCWVKDKCQSFATNGQYHSSCHKAMLGWLEQEATA